MGFDYKIQYKSGKGNLAVDALSKIQGAEMLCMVVYVLDSNLSALIIASY